MEIISTVGPSFKKHKMFRQTFNAGCTGYRFNSSHMDKELTISQMEFIRGSLNANLILDLRGHKIRVSSKIKTIDLNPGDKIIIASEKYFAENKSNSEFKILPLSVDFNFSRMFEKEKLFAKDGKITFLKEEMISDEACFYIVNGQGRLYKDKGITAPYINRLGLPLTQKDKEDILFGLENKIDTLYLSYVVEKKNVADVKEYIRKLIKKNPDFKMPKIYSKIETKQAIENFSEILRASDGIVLGRGDLYTETSILEYPSIENDILKKMKNNKKDLIIATHVLGSMRFNTKPTTSEASDLYKFVQNKVNGVVLVTETSVAGNPYNAVKFAKTFTNYNESKTIQLENSINIIDVSSVENTDNIDTLDNTYIAQSIAN